MLWEYTDILRAVYWKGIFFFSLIKFFPQKSYNFSYRSFLHGCLPMFGEYWPFFFKWKQSEFIFRFHLSYRVRCKERSLCKKKKKNLQWQKGLYNLPPSSSSRDEATRDLLYSIIKQRYDHVQFAKRWYEFTLREIDDIGNRLWECPARWQVRQILYSSNQTSEASNSL